LLTFNDFSTGTVTVHVTGGFPVSNQIKSNQIYFAQKTSHLDIASSKNS